MTSNNDITPVAENPNLLLGNIKNDKQVTYNAMVGDILELKGTDDYCQITIMAGVEKPRHVNFSIKKIHFDIVKSQCKVGDKVKIYFYPVSKLAKKNQEQYYTTCWIIDVEKIVFGN